MQLSPGALSDEMWISVGRLALGPLNPGEGAWQLLVAISIFFVVLFIFYEPIPIFYFNPVIVILYIKILLFKSLCGFSLLTGHWLIYRNLGNSRYE